MIEKVLIANRGEIAVRVIRTLRRLGIASVAVYSDADAGARHVTEADEAIRIGPAAAAASYLNIDAIIAAASAAGADAIHPGYGFLAENAAFARAAADAGLVFIGPPPDAIEAMGDKIAAKARVSAAGVPVVPEVPLPSGTDSFPRHDPRFPVIVKPSAGGGGKGMVVVRTPAELPAAVESAKRTALAAFGDDRLLIEKYIARPRHIEIQVLADTHGNVVHLGERECSLQRRHQKVIEEAPSPFLDPARREAMGKAAVEAARSVGYTGAGTVEFIVDGGDPDQFFFMEMNTRLQVEHPVTELVAGLDLVEWQIRVASGEPLSCGRELRISGHAIEARVYAEDPARGFLPTGGTVLSLREPAGEGVRVDSGLAAGTTVTSAYDPMLAKVIAWGEDRATALRRLDAALAGTVVLGVTTNIAFLRTLLADPDVQAGNLDTDLIARIPETVGFAQPAGDEVLAAAAFARLLTAAGADPWDAADGWRPSGRAWTKFRFRTGDAHAEVRVRNLSEVAVGDGEPVAASARFDGADLLLTYGGRNLRFACARDGETTWLGRDGHAWALSGERAAPVRGGAAARGDGIVRSPMPGTVLAVRAAPGDPVTAGQPLVVVEAMKMEHTVTAPVDGTVTELAVQPGQQVQLDEPLAVVKQSGVKQAAERQEAGADAQLPARRRARRAQGDGRGLRTGRRRPRYRGPLRTRRVPVRDRREDGRDGPVRPAGRRGVRRHGRRLLRALPRPGGTRPC
jgi:acetyl-CoA/propionyl-CoA carboxylase biotin carboxyl carrier protein